MIKKKKTHTDGDMSKGQRNQLKELSIAEAETAWATK